MTLIERWTSRLVATTRDTASKMAKEDVKKAVNVTADIVKLLLFVGFTASALKSAGGVSKAAEAVTAAAPMVQIVLTEGKEVVIR